MERTMHFLLLALLITMGSKTLYPCKHLILMTLLDAHFNWNPRRTASICVPTSPGSSMIPNGDTPTALPDWIKLLCFVNDNQNFRIPCPPTISSTTLRALTKLVMTLAPYAVSLHQHTPRPLEVPWQGLQGLQLQCHNGTGEWGDNIWITVSSCCRWSCHVHHLGQGGNDLLWGGSWKEFKPSAKFSEEVWLCRQPSQALLMPHCSKVQNEKNVYIMATFLFINAFPVINMFVLCSCRRQLTVEWKSLKQAMTTVFIFLSFWMMPLLHITS